MAVNLKGVVGTEKWCNAIEAALEMDPDGAEHVDYAQLYFSSVEYLGQDDGRLIFTPAATCSSSAIHLAHHPVTVIVISHSTLFIESAGRSIAVEIDVKNIRRVPSLELKKSTTGGYRYGLKFVDGVELMEDAMAEIAAECQADSIIYQAIVQTVRACMLA